jgi:hypothetical protein
VEKTQIYLRTEERAAVRAAAAPSGRSIADVIRDAQPQREDPVAIWDGQPRRSSMEHDSAHDEV